MTEYDDKTEILEILNLYGFALAAHQWQLFDRIFTEDVIAEFGPAGVRVNAISTGVIRTPNADGSDRGAHPAEVMMQGTPAGRSGTPDAVAHAAVYLASDEAAFVHGSVIDVDGGRTGVAVVAA